MSSGVIAAAALAASPSIIGVQTAEALRSLPSGACGWEAGQRSSPASAASRPAKRRARAWPDRTCERTGRSPPRRRRRRSSSPIRHQRRRRQRRFPSQCAGQAHRCADRAQDAEEDSARRWRSRGLRHRTGRNGKRRGRIRGHGDGSRCHGENLERAGEGSSRGALSRPRRLKPVPARLSLSKLDDADGVTPALISARATSPHLHARWSI